ncbi:hypothetical protein ACCO45_005922 [Purpureocillium lilacinum]|uniref:Uncharacterized protein n=1 Tax=Purpureocillium lilacinum TaxID=33203 RepID=A0ACC4DWV8_PURLI
MLAAAAAEEEEFRCRGVAVLAAGGIADEQGVAAALALGAEGVVMGTRTFARRLSSRPSTAERRPSSRRSTTASTTTRSGAPYDGRAIMTAIHERFLAGASLEDCQRSLKEDYAAEDSAKLIGTWAGTGVGLVKTAQAAGDIVKEVREGAKEQIRRLAASL